jgi:hypothetical protein
VINFLNANPTPLLQAEAEPDYDALSALIAMDIAQQAIGPRRRSGTVA